MKKSIFVILTSLSLLSATYHVGDVVSNFSGPLCANGSGTLNLYDYNGAENGGNYYVIWIILFTSW